LLTRNEKMTKAGPLQSASRRAGRSIARFLRRMQAPAYPGSPPAWTNGMSMAAVLIFFLILLLHPYDEVLSRSLSSYGPLSRVRQLTDIGLSQWYLIPAFAIAVCLIGIDWGNIARHRRMRFGLVYAQATFAFWAIALSGILTNIAKFLIGRARPKFIDTLGANSFSPLEAGYNFASFPSGHSTTMGAVGAVLALWFPRWRVPIILGTMFIAFTRIIARAHYPTDVLAGYSVGFLFSIALARLLAGRRTAFLFEGTRFWPVLRFRERFWRPEIILNKK
jgi:membrane-associated phospholipid phosphatase